MLCRGAVLGCVDECRRGGRSQETRLIGLSAKLYHIRGMGRGWGTRVTLALQAPGSFASFAGPALHLTVPRLGAEGTLPSGLPSVLHIVLDRTDTSS